MPQVQPGPVAGLLAQALVLAVLAGTVGLDVPGWLAGIGSGLATGLALNRALTREDRTRLGPADRVTLTRATLAGGVAALTADSFHRAAPVPALVTLAAVALVLDWVDGQVARRTGTSSALGARFDLEVDAFLILVLSGYVAPEVGAWVLPIGLARYLLLAAERVWPWLGRDTPPRHWAKVVAACQGIALTVVAAGVLPLLVERALLGGCLVLLAESFGRQVLWLRSHRQVPAYADRLAG